jgi:hypothetical protein
MASKRLCACFDPTKPGLWQLITVEFFIMLGQKSFSTGGLEVQFEEVDRVQEPSDVDILLPTSHEHWLLLMIGVCLSL